MENLFSTLISFRAAEYSSIAIEEYRMELGGFLKKKIMPAVLIAGMASQAAPTVHYETMIREKSFIEIVKEHQTGKKDNSAPEPEKFPGQVVGTSLLSANTGASGDQVAMVSWRHTLVQKASQDEPYLGYQVVYEANGQRIVRIF